MKVEPIEIADWHHLRVVGVKDGKDVAFNDMQFSADGLAQPLPPEELRWRVSSSRDDVFYRVTGMKTFGEFYGAIQKYCDLSEKRSLLDWGCGCGRVASLLFAYTEELDIYGCDIDAEAIRWCQENLEGGDDRFCPIPLHPPTDYSDDQFDLVIGYSVCTHLSRKNQLAWLRELRRITKPGGTVFLSVHGVFAAQFQGPEASILKEILEHGISDRTPDLNLDGVAPESYYRGVFQTPEYTKRTWGEIFDVIDYVERGMGNFHDLVVLRNSKRTSGSFGSRLLSLIKPMKFLQR